MRCESRYVFFPGNRNSSDTKAYNYSVLKLRLQLLLCKSSIDVFEKAHLAMFSEMYV